MSAVEAAARTTHADTMAQQGTRGQVSVLRKTRLEAIAAVQPEPLAVTPAAAEAAGAAA